MNHWKTIYWVNLCQKTLWGRILFSFDLWRCVSHAGFSVIWHVEDFARIAVSCWYCRMRILLCTTSFFPGGSVRFLKNTIFQKSGRQWVRVPGHDMGLGREYHTKKCPDVFSWKLPDVQWQEINFCLLWLRGVDLSVCVCKASGNQSWMILITGKFVEFPRLVARNLKVDGSNGGLLAHI